MADEKKQTYWEIRAIEQEKKVHQELNAYEKKIVNAYLKAQKYLSSEAKKIYSRYLNKSGLTESEVERILNSTVSLEELTELKALANSIEDQGIKKQAQDYLNGLAVKHRITRLEDLKAKSYLVSKQLADVQLKQSTDYYIKAIEEAYTQAAAESIVNQVEQAYESYDDGKYHSYTIKDDKVIEDIYVKMQKDESIPEFKELSTEQTKHILDSNWKGSNYSKRIWKDTDLLAEQLEEMFTVKQLTGMSEREMVKELVEQFEVSTGIAERLLRTEANYMAMQAKLRGWKEHGVEEYVLVAVLDFKTSNICQSMDGKRFKVEEAVVNGKDGNYPPFHPWCRTVAIAYFGKRSLNGKRTANDPVTGKTFTINQSDTYKDWEEMLLDKHGQSDLDLKKKKVKNYKSDLEQYRRYQDIIGEKYIPKSFDGFQEMKYNKGVDYQSLKALYSDVKWQKDALKKLQKTTERRMPTEGTPNSVVDQYKDDNLYQRRYFGSKGKPRLDLDATSHGNDKRHPVTPHAHSWTAYEKTKGEFDAEREIHWRELTFAEKIANMDLLERND